MGVRSVLPDILAMPLSNSQKPMASSNGAIGMDTHSGAVQPKSWSVDAASAIVTAMSPHSEMTRGMYPDLKNR